MSASPDPHAAPIHSGPDGAAHGEPPRRGLFKKALAIVAGGVAVTGPLAAGLAVFLDPITRRKKDAASAGGGAEFLTIAPLDAVPADGSAQKFQVIADRSDAWNKYPNVPIGAVYLKRDGGGGAGAPRVVAFNVVCPHAGCFVDVAQDGKSFLCPCHNSAFNADGSIGEICVSPRGLDELDVDPDGLKNGVVRVRFQNFAAGRADKVPVS